MIDATTIDAAPPTADRDTTDAADTTTNLNAETTMVGAITRSDATATTVERRRRKGHGKKTATIKKIDATTMIVVKKSKLIMPTIATRVATTRQKTSTKIRTSTTTTY